MKKLLQIMFLVGLAAVWAAPALATNGDILIGVGPISRSMGGVGIAAPQDAISAVFSNPAAMCFGPYCPASEFNFAGTLFAPKVDAKVQLGGQSIKADSHENVYAIPAIGISTPITKSMPLWRFGLAAYGVSGLGVDYRDTSLDQQRFANFGGFPLIAGEYTSLQIMKFAPAISFEPDPRISFGLAAHINYAMLDLGSGTSTDYTYGVQLGVLYKPLDKLSLGATYITPQKNTFDRVKDFNGDGARDSFDLEAPQQAGLGVAYDILPNKLLVEIDGKWINWSGAAGYKEFDWEDQWVFGLGAQYRATDKLILRAGYNYANNPVKSHNGWNGLAPQNVQGKIMPTYYYETFRTIGFPAVTKSHITLGLGYEFTPRFSVNVGYTYGFGETITGTGTALNGQPVKLESNLTEMSYELGLTWRF
ncbi:MAG: outer membrane protein transport protein [Deltaproteobacteria bacterium]|nr:outer membrane protein transport protein [Deltaproteobacteria bacterium]